MCITIEIKLPLPRLLTPLLLVGVWHKAPATLLVLYARPQREAGCEEAGRWLFQRVLGGRGMFRGQSELPKRVFGVNLEGFQGQPDLYETHEILVLGFFGVFRSLSRSLATPPPRVFEVNLEGFRGQPDLL